MECMFGMDELQLQIGGHQVTDQEMEALVEGYLLIYCAAYLCKIAPAFSQHVDEDDPTIDEAMDDEEYKDDVDEANVFIVFDRGDDKALRPQEVILPFYFALLEH